MKSYRPLILVIATLFCAPVIAAQDAQAPSIELGAPFADFAILQRESAVPVWGWSKPGTSVTVEFAGQTKTAKADKDGKWTVKLDSMPASAESREMAIREKGGATRVLKDILVGEVWMASGQSNMQWLAEKCDVNLLAKQLLDENAANGGKEAPIREFVINNYFSNLHPIEHAAGDWKHGAYGSYSAIAFAFAHKLYKELGIPIGILNCSFSQTSIESWTPRDSFAEAKDPISKNIYQEILQTDPKTPEHKKVWSEFYKNVEKALVENQKLAKEGKEIVNGIDSIKPPGNMHDNRDASWMFNGHLNPVIPYSIRGAIWNQGYANINGGIQYYNNLHNLIRGWRKCWNQPELPVYFNQFYCPDGGGDNQPSFGPMTEMRLGTWLARDIPHTGMAIQIDIEGAIHYRNKAVSGQRLALHALKNQYGKSVETDGPMFKSCRVDGDKLIIQFDHAEGGLLVAETGSNAIGKEPSATGFSDPTVIPNGDDKVKLFYLADEDRVWHQAEVKISGEEVIVTSSAVKKPVGVSYATAGVGFQPNLYNQALLPTTPFMIYDNKLVTKADWPDQALKVAGVKEDTSTFGKLYEYRKMPIISNQFLENAVLQADKPITFWGSTRHDFGYEAKGKAEIRFSFNGIEKTIPVTPGMTEWEVTVPAMPASSEPKTLKVTFWIDGELVHERICKNIVIGDVWYVAGVENADLKKEGEDVGDVRVMTRLSKEATAQRPHRYTVATSMTPLNRFASYWGCPTPSSIEKLANALHAKSGKPVGIIYMQGVDVEIKHWMDAESLSKAPSLADDYKNVAALVPGTKFYAENTKRYLNEWKEYWGKYIPELMATKRVPDAAPWGKYPSFAGTVESDATKAYNVMVCSFRKTKVKGIIFQAGPLMVEKDKGKNFGSELSALANGFKRIFGGDDSCFIYTMPSKELAAEITKPADIKGKNRGVEVANWPAATGKKGKGEPAAGENKEIDQLIEAVLAEAYP